MRHKTWSPPLAELNQTFYGKQMRKQENGKGKQKLGDVINNLLGAITYLGSYLKKINKINAIINILESYLG